MLLTGTSLILVCIAAFALLPTVAWASGPARTVTLAAGPYIVNVNLYQDPPVTDQSVEVTVVPQESGIQLSGRIVMMPGLGTDAVELHSQLSPMGQTSTLVGSVRMPVRGAWQIVVQLSGPRGAGEASFPVTVAGPGAIPVWLGWLIALTPMLGIAWLLWHQFRYRQKLVAHAKQ
jgi:hypothetical protein